MNLYVAPSSSRQLIMGESMILPRIYGNTQGYSSPHCRLTVVSRWPLIRLTLHTFPEVASPIMNTRFQYPGEGCRLLHRRTRYISRRYVALFHPRMWLTPHELDPDVRVGSESVSRESSTFRLSVTAIAVGRP